MHIFFSGIGGTGIGPLALIAHQAGFSVSGSDKQDSDYISYLKNQGISNITIGQSKDLIAKVHESTPIDWFVYSSAIIMEGNAPELEYCNQNSIKTSKRDELINHILSEKHLKMIAVAGTHGKTTTTAMLIWLLKQCGTPISYSLGAKISFGEMGEYSAKSEYFIYEADEFDRNFLQFSPYAAVIPGIAYDHPDIYPTKDDYNQAFLDFFNKSTHVFAHQKDLTTVKSDLLPSEDISSLFTLPGQVNRENAALVVSAAHAITGVDRNTLIEHLNTFPGVSRRFEKITDHIYSDYAHTPEKIAGALQLAHEVAGNNVVAVYEGLHNTRQHFIKDQLPNMFKGIKKLYIVPSYLAREDESLEMLSPAKLCEITEYPDVRVESRLDDTLKQRIQAEVTEGNLVLCLSAGGGGSLDEWLRKNF